jgi:hypothetical protein
MTETGVTFNTAVLAIAAKTEPAVMGWDDWHEPLPTPRAPPATPAPVAVVEEADEEGESEEDYEDGVCRGCGGYFDCRCDEHEDDGWCSEPEDDDGYVLDSDDGEFYPRGEEPVSCPCCGFKGPTEPEFYPYCGNKCYKYRD